MKINLEILDASYLVADEVIEDLRTKELVPKMVLRRRLTRASKLVIELIDKVSFEKGRIFYGSAYGELPATANILNDILNNNGVSPTDFQNSVYNTPVSYASILKGNESELITISSGDETSDKLLKMGAIKALDGDEILLVGTETINIKNINEVNSCIDFLECAVALKVKVTTEKATIDIENNSLDSNIPNSLDKLYLLAKAFKKDSKNIVEIKI